LVVAYSVEDYFAIVSGLLDTSEKRLVLAQSAKVNLQ
jgi:hypothetical protein